MLGKKYWRMYAGALAFALCLSTATTILASEAGQAAADQVTEASYRYFLGDSLMEYGILYTHNGHNRGVDGAQHDLCRDNIQFTFQSYGLSVQLEPVSLWRFYLLQRSRHQTRHRLPRPGNRRRCSLRLGQ